LEAINEVAGDLNVDGIENLLDGAQIHGARPFSGPGGTRTKKKLLVSSFEQNIKPLIVR